MKTPRKRRLATLSDKNPTKSLIKRRKGSELSSKCLHKKLKWSKKTKASGCDTRAVHPTTFGHSRQ